jgi:hypothetical protein
LGKDELIKGEIKMSKVWFPAFDEYIKDYESRKEFYPRTRYDQEYDKLETELLTEILIEAYGRQPTKEEIEEQRIEFMKLKYFAEEWEKEYFEKIKKECEMEKEQKSHEKSLQSKTPEA